MKSFIILRDLRDSGKSTILRKVIKKITDSPNSNVLHSANYFGDKRFWENGKDGLAIISSGKIVVGIITNGDPGSEEEVKKYLDTCKKHSCSVIVTASRTKGAVQDILLNFGSEESANVMTISPIRLHNNTSQDLRNQLNEICAKSIIEIIEIFK